MFSDFFFGEMRTREFEETHEFRINAKRELYRKIPGSAERLGRRGQKGIRQSGNLYFFLHVKQSNSARCIEEKLNPHKKLRLKKYIN